MYVIIIYYSKKNRNTNVLHNIFTNWQKLFSKREYFPLSVILLEI